MSTAPSSDPTSRRPSTSPLLFLLGFFGTIVQLAPTLVDLNHPLVLADMKGWLFRYGVGLTGFTYLSLLLLVLLAPTTPPRWSVPGLALLKGALRGAMIVSCVYLGYAAVGLFDQHMAGINRLLARLVWVRADRLPPSLLPLSRLYVVTLVAWTVYAMTMRSLRHHVHRHRSANAPESPASRTPDTSSA